MDKDALAKALIGWDRDTLLPFARKLENGQVVKGGGLLGSDWHLAAPQMGVDMWDAVKGVGNSSLTAPYNPDDRERMIEGAGAWVGPQVAAGFGRAMMTPKGGAELGSAGGKLPVELPMDQASRMARAKEMGFREFPVYHGTAADGGTIFPAFDHLAQGGRTSGSRAGQEGVSVALRPEVANEFAALAAERSGGDPTVMKLLHRTERPAVLHLEDGAKNLEVAATLNNAFANGYDSVVMRNYTTPNGQKNQTAVVLKDPSQLRSVNAAFDPAKRDSANLLAAESKPASPMAALDVFKQDTPGIRAYHGSPHDFDKFDMSKIGTGEGAQAYGHGLYFAESEPVAKSYRDKLTDGASFIRPDGSFWDPGELRHLNVRVTARRDGLDAAIAKAKELSAPPYTPTTVLAGRDLAVLEKLQTSGGIKPNPGRMYEVNINASPDQFLDWDKPLSQQSAVVRKALGHDLAPEASAKAEALAKRLENVYAMLGTTPARRPVDPLLIRQADQLEKQLQDSDPKGVSRLKLSAIADGEKGASALRDAGIPGIRYKDQGSRGSEGGTNNYVVFDDKLIEILRKYGLAGLMAGGAAAQSGGPVGPQSDDEWRTKIATALMK